MKWSSVFQAAIGQGNVCQLALVPALRLEEIAPPAGSGSSAPRNKESRCRLPMAVAPAFSALFFQVRRYRSLCGKCCVIAVDYTGLPSALSLIQQKRRFHSSATASMLEAWFRFSFQAFSSVVVALFADTDPTVAAQRCLTVSTLVSKLRLATTHRWEGVQLGGSSVHAGSFSGGQPRWRRLRDWSSILDRSHHIATEWC